MNILNLINEEINGLLNEVYTINDNRLKFKQKLTNVTFQNNASISNDFDTKITEQLINIGWNVSLRVNDMGIEEFNVEIDGVEGNIKVEMRDKQSDEIKQENFKDINDYNWKFQFDDEEIVLQQGKELYVVSADFNFLNSICTVSFTE